MGDTKIQWTATTNADGTITKGKTWNPTTGCTKVSQGCKNCFAERMAKRLAGRVGYPEAPNQFNLTLHPERLELPLHWKKPSRIFVDSMSDLFHEDVPDEFIDAVFGVMAASPMHTFQVLTKRPERMQRWVSDPARALLVDTMKYVTLAGRIDERFAPEQRKPIPGFPGYWITSKGAVLSEHRGGLRPMKPMPGDDGHSRVMLYSGAQTSRPLIHRLVLESFDRLPLENEQGCHIDRDATNNSLWNLRWGTQADNWDDSKRHGTRRRYFKLSAEQVDAIRKRHTTGESMYSIAKSFGVSDTQVRNIVKGYQWTDEPKPEWPLGTVWLGVSAENQSAADERIPWLLKTPAAVKFVSCEPLLGPIDLELMGANYGLGSKHEYLDWVIAGCESGPGRRLANPDWFRSLRDQCHAAGVPFFLKQMEVEGKIVHRPQLDGDQWTEFPKVML